MSTTANPAAVLSEALLPDAEALATPRDSEHQAVAAYLFAAAAGRFDDVELPGGGGDLTRAALEVVEIFRRAGAQVRGEALETASRAEGLELRDGDGRRRRPRERGHGPRGQ